MNAHFHKDYVEQQEKILDFIKNFNKKGTFVTQGNRNSIKKFVIDDVTLNVKSFKIPNLVNKIAYNFLRKSKAKRSFLYANMLISKQIGTPKPIGYAEQKTTFLFLKSYYICEHLECDLTYRELVQQPNLPNHEEILRAFTRFTFKLHEAKVLFLDHSSGNTLIKIIKNNYEFYLVDLNRMKFKTLSFEERMKNFSRLTPKREMVEVMANEYAKLINEPEDEVYNKMWFYTNQFQEKFKRKKELKKKLQF